MIFFEKFIGINPYNYLSNFSVFLQMLPDGLRPDAMGVLKALTFNLVQK